MLAIIKITRLAKRPIMIMCRVLGVTRSGFYAWLHTPLSERAIEDQRLLGLIRASYAASYGVYGSPRVFLDLREAGEGCGKHVVRTHWDEAAILDWPEPALCDLDRPEDYERVRAQLVGGA